MCNAGATKKYMRHEANKTLQGKRSIFGLPKKSTPSKESAPPPVLRSSSSSASARNLGIKNRGNVNKRKVASGRRTSKAKTFRRSN